MSAKPKEPARVVVTGVGAVTAQGVSADAFWQAVKSGRVAIREVKKIPMEGFRTRIAGEVQDEVKPQHDYTRPEDHRDPVIDFALKAAEEALEKSRVEMEKIPAERWGVVMGTCNAGLLSGEKWYQAGMRGETADPKLLLLVPPQALAEAVSGAFGIKGPVLSIDTACAAGANAIGYAAELVRYGQADAVLTGGSDALSDVLIAGFNSLESLSPKPAAPYSKNRTGLSLGEGSGMLVLMREDLARRLGAPILAEVMGYGLSADGYHATAPHPEGKGASRAIRAALSSAGLAPEQVRYVNSHGTGTPKNDPAETKATKLGLGAAAEKAAVSSTKSMIGHLLGAAGAVEGIITVKALEEQIAPPTANYEERDPECDLDYVPNTARPLKMDVAISNNFAFGGANASVVLARGGALGAAPPLPDYDGVVVTGLATLTSAGCDVDAVWKAFSEGRNTTKLEDGLRIGRVDLDPSPFLKPKDRRRMDKLGVFSVVAAHLALRDAGLELNDENRNRVGVIFGTGVGPMESMENFSRPLLQEGPAAANPAIFPNTVYNAAGGQVAMHVGALGPASTVTAGHAAGASAICYGYDLTSCSQADAILCLAADTLTDTVIRAYKQLGLLASEPAATEHGGFALAEAGIAVLLERATKAQARGARVYGELLGYGIASDGRGVGKFDREGQGMERAMKLALERAGLRPGDVKAIWSGLSGYGPADAAEQAAIRRLFGNSAPALLSPKTLMGEPMGAGGALGAALAVKAWQQGGQGAPPAGPVLVNSASLGGTHFSLVLAPYAAGKGAA
jgi:3-oxoacyl-[acyl-carrier-protein] synthase II